jgi:hypothetical protein
MLRNPEKALHIVTVSAEFLKGNVAAGNFPNACIEARDVWLVPALLWLSWFRITLHLQDVLSYTCQRALASCFGLWIRLGIVLRDNCEGTSVEFSQCDPLMVGRDWDSD